MKNTKVLSLFSVALFALTGCKKTCSKDEFIKLANKTEPDLRVYASAKVKGKVASKSQGVSQTYEPDETFDFTFNKNGYWSYDGDSDYSSTGTVKQSVITSCLVLITVSVKDLVDENVFTDDSDIGKLTCYSSPLGFNYKVTYKDYKQSDETLGLEMIVNGKSDSSYTFDDKTGFVTQYIEKSDLTMDISIDDVKTSSTTVSDIQIDITYSKEK